MHQNATPLRKSAPSSINISGEHVSCTAPAMRNASLQILSKCPKVFETDKTLTFYSLLGRCKIPCACDANHILTSKSAPRPPLFLLTLLTSTCGLHHNGVHFYNISTSKSAPSMVCFAHFALEMCFPPQRRALFHHVNSQKWSDIPSVFSLFTSTCASRHDGVHFFIISTSKALRRRWGVLGKQFFISHLATWLRTRDLPAPQNIGKTQCFATFLPFRAPASSFFWLFLFSDFSHLCFSICPYCRKFAFWTSFGKVSENSHIISCHWTIWT